MTEPRPTARPVVLCVLDGFGLSDDPKRNALLSARMPAWDALTATWPTCRLQASGEAVGLPAGQMGNSEVGHLNLGAGFPVLQDLPRISKAIADGTFYGNPVLRGVAEHALQRGSRLHLMGLIGPGGIHAVDGHIEAMAELAHRAGLPADRVLLHAFTDGRDTPPRSAHEFLPALEARLDGRATTATISGRFYAMDRDRRWERTALAWEALVHGQGERAATGAEAIANAYLRGEGDEFIRPTVIGAYAGMRDGDAAVHLNFRADRARQLTRALALDGFDAFDRGRRPADLAVATLTEYQAPDELPVPVAFPPLEIDSLAAYLSRLGKRQFHLAETEKYAHVTYFFNGGVEEQLPGEDRLLVPSRRDVPTYDLAPEMSAPDITDALVDAVRSGAYDFIVVNYANADMVGHTGVWDAAVRAAEVLDGCLWRVSEAVLGVGGTLVITADHGNIEEMRDPQGNPQTKHTTSPVPLVLVSEAWRGARLRDGILADVAPTLCQLMGIPAAPQMTGRSLLVAGG
ncbi:MAG TPA: 2,3-bisphosphoglycerate-independent phosphoglycerate mutase [candidate division Zixibacteria bacterium]|nr:2,3-bisphosphoglycerate-independent phosphoglycerate mutase [candidate division Zixibacteria bacterium]